MKQETIFENFELLADAPNSVQKLRELILQLAFQGKLLPQDPNDEPASSFLKRIRVEKERLIEEKKIKKNKPLPPIKEGEIPYAIPSTWNWVRLIDVFDVRDGTHDSPKYIPKGIPLVTSKNLSNDFLDLTNVNYISEEDHRKISERSKVEENDILFAMIGSIGNPIIVDTLSEFSIKNVALFKYYAPKLSAPKFLKYFLIQASSKMREQAAGGVQSFVSLGYLRNYIFPFPSLEEQKRIVAKVDQLMALCDQLEARQQKKHEQRIRLNNAALDKLLTAPTPEEFPQHWQRICDNFDLLYDAPETVGQLRQAILQLAVQGKLVPQDPGDEPSAVLLEKIKVEKERLIKENRIKSIKPIPKIEPEELNFKVPDCYEIIRLGECIDLISGQHLRKNEQNDQGEGIPYLTGPADFGKVNPIAKRWTSHQKAISEKNDILITVKGAGVGKTNILGLEKAAIGRQLMAIRPVVVYQKYVYLMILASYDNFQSLSDGSTVPGIERKDILHFPLGLPPFEEQKRIVTKADQLMALCDELEARLAQAQTDGGKLMEAVVHHVLAA